MPEIVTHAVISSNILEVGHDATTNTLRVVFKSGKNGKERHTYDYNPVTEEGYKELVSAESIGKYFHTFIGHNDKITYKRIN